MKLNPISLKDFTEEELKERMEHVTIDDQILNSYRRETMALGFVSMVPKNTFSPWDLTDNIFQGATQGQFHRKTTFMSRNGEKCSLKEESNSFPSEVHVD